MKKTLLHFLGSCLLLVLMAGQALAQDKTISGKILDEKGTAIPGAGITDSKSKRGTLSDAEGNFSLNVPSSSRSLTISYIGYITQFINIETKSQFNIRLVPEISALNELVVVGYGTAKKKDLTGAVSSITAKDFNQGLVLTPMDQVQGKVPGLVVTSPDGDPNSNPIIRLRGQTSLLGTQAPLLVVDGIILDNYEILSNIPPADIVSFDVLKDASASAIYGSRGANGVIIISTKRGKSGSFQIDYTGSATLSKDAKYYDLLNTADFIKLAASNGFGVIANQGPAGSSTDWQKAITQTGYTQSHYIGLSGGSGNFNYSGSATYQDQKGIVINTGRQVLGLRLSLEQKALNDKLDLQLNSFTSQTDHQNVDGNIFNWALYIPPVVPVYLSGVLNPINNYNYKNPVFVEQNEVRKSVDYLKQESLTINYELIKGLKVGGAGYINRFNTQYNYYLPSIPGPNTTNQAFKYNGNTNSSKGEGHINYAGEFGKHSVTATGVYEYNYFEDDRFLATAQAFPLDATAENSLQSGVFNLNVPVTSYKEESKLISFLARGTYNYDSKYYVTASIRRDGSSKFGANNRWGYFPSASAAWRISKESFLKDVSWLDELKINAGYGQTGNSDPISDYNTLLLLSGQTHSYDATNSTNPYPVGYSAAQNPNPDLKWERRIGENIGAEFSLFKGRLSGSISYFNDKTKDLLYNYGVQTPPNFVSSVLANVGSMTNKGFEFGFNSQIVSRKDISWNLGGQITIVRTRVTSLSGTWEGNQVSTDQIQLSGAGGPGLSGNPLTYLKVGYFPTVFYLPHFTGIDAQGNQLLDSAGVKSVGFSGNPTYNFIDPSPKFTYGINTSFRYKNWNLTANFNGNYGQKIYDNTRLDLANYPRFPGLNVLYETFTNGLKDSPTTSDYWLEKASFLRLNNATISYNVPGLKGIQGLRLFITGNNLFILTKYKGLDPEISPINNAGGSRASIGNNATNISGLGGGGSGSGFIDNSFDNSGFYPRSRSYTFGVSINLK